MSDDERTTLSNAALAATALARERYALHETVRHRLLTDFGQGQHPTPQIQNLKSKIQNCSDLKLNKRLTEWYALDFATFRTELRKAFKAEIPVKERTDWETALAGWQRQHADLTARLVAIETDIDDRVCHLFGLTPADRRLLADHSRHAMIDYQHGAV